MKLCIYGIRHILYFANLPYLYIYRNLTLFQHDAPDLFAPHFSWPQWEEADGDDAQDDGTAGQIVVPRRRVVQPHVGVVT